MPVPFLLGHRRSLHLFPRRLGLRLSLARVLHDVQELTRSRQRVLGPSQTLRRPAPALFAVLVHGAHVVDPRGRLDRLDDVDVVEAKPIGGARAGHLPRAGLRLLAVHGVKRVALHHHLAPRREGRVGRVADERILVRLLRRRFPSRLVIREILLKRLRGEPSRHPEHRRVTVRRPTGNHRTVANLRMELGGVIGVYPLRLVSNRVHVRRVVKVGPGVDLTEG